MIVDVIIMVIIAVVGLWQTRNDRRKQCTRKR